jgi:hypothetical protein
LARSCNFAFSVEDAGIAYNTFRLHQKNDPEFALQVREAEQQAAELLHVKCFTAAFGILNAPRSRGFIRKPLLLVTKQEAIA